MFSQKDLYVLNTRFVAAAVICEKYEDSPLLKKALDLLHLPDSLALNVLRAAADGTGVACNTYSSWFGGIMPGADLVGEQEDTANLYDHLCANLVEFLFEYGVSGAFDEDEFAELGARFSNLDAQLSVPEVALPELVAELSERKALLKAAVACGRGGPNAANAIARLGAALAVLQ